MSAITGPNNITNGLVLSLDAASQRSYVSGSTVWYDVSGNGNNGTLTNGPGYNSGNGGALTFSGSNNYVILQSIVNLGINYTVQWWMNISAWNGEPIGGTASNKYVSFIDPTTMYHTPAMPSSTTNFPHGLSLNTITNCCIVRIGNNVSYYRNGSIYSTGSGTGTTDMLIQYIGIEWNSPTPAYRYAYSGSIYNAQIYNRALSSDEIAQNFNSQRFRFGI